MVLVGVAQDEVRRGSPAFGRPNMLLHVIMDVPTYTWLLAQSCNKNYREDDALSSSRIEVGFRRKSSTASVEEDCCASWVVPLKLDLNDIARQ